MAAIDAWHEAPSKSDPIAQGDQVLNVEHFEVRHPPTGDPIVAVQDRDFIILTQSCDTPGHSTLLVAPIEPLYDWAARNPHMFPDLENIRKGEFTSYYILPRFAGAMDFNRDRIATLDDLISLPRAEIERAIDSGRPRLKMKSPPREHFAQSVARSLMRVGLPVDIDPYKFEQTDSAKSAVQTLGAGLRFREEQKTTTSHHRRTKVGDQITKVTVHGPNGAYVQGIGETDEGALASLRGAIEVRRAECAAGDTKWQWLEDLF